MVGMDGDKEDRAKARLSGAYELDSPDDNRTYYQSFAEDYDDGFAEALGYAFPAAIAAAYRAMAANADIPVADVVCGTGLVAAALGLARDRIDGMDISPGMLAKARAKGLYRALIEVDLTGDISHLAARYGAVLSAGTFTHEHLGPEPLVNLLGIARAGGLFVIGVNGQHYEDRQFDAALEPLLNDGVIRNVAVENVKIYDKTGHEHSEDTALILTFRKC